MSGWPFGGHLDYQMGADFRNRWFFAGVDDPDGARAALVATLRGALHRAGFGEVADEADADRSLVVGPAGRWVFVGDSAGSRRREDPEGFDALSSAASDLGPVVDVRMEDSRAVFLRLYRRGRLVDRFGVTSWRFATEDEADSFRGRPELWADLLAAPEAVDALRSAWARKEAADPTWEMYRLLGWDPPLWHVGYTHDDEGEPTKYDEYLEDMYGPDHGVALDAFDEYHFKRLQ